MTRKLADDFDEAHKRVCAEWEAQARFYARLSPAEKRAAWTTPKRDTRGVTGRRLHQMLEEMIRSEQVPLSWRHRSGRHGGNRR